jgi:hypothetical protein
VAGDGWVMCLVWDTEHCNNQAFGTSERNNLINFELTPHLQLLFEDSYLHPLLVPQLFSSLSLSSGPRPTSLYCFLIHLLLHSPCSKGLDLLERWLSLLDLEETITNSQIDNGTKDEVQS